MCVCVRPSVRVCVLPLDKSRWWQVMPAHFKPQSYPLTLWFITLWSAGAPLSDPRISPLFRPPLAPPAYPSPIATPFPQPRLPPDLSLRRVSSVPPILFQVFIPACPTAITAGWGRTAPHGLVTLFRGTNYSLLLAYTAGKLRTCRGMKVQHTSVNVWGMVEVVLIHDCKLG